MFKMKRKMTRLASLILAAAISAPLFWGAGVARAAAVPDAATEVTGSVAATPAARVTTGVSTPSNPVQLLLGPVTPQSTISEVSLSSDTSSVKTGALEPFEVTTTTRYVHVRPYGQFTEWGYKKSAQGEWYSFVGDTPYAVNDGSTYYGMCITVYLEKGAVFSNDPTIYFNGKKITGSKVFGKNNDRSAVIWIDLGKAKGSSSISLHTITYDSNGGTTVNPRKVVDGCYALKPLDPRKDGMYFWGWYFEPEFRSRYYFDVPVTKDLTLYARWETYSREITDVAIRGNVVTLQPGDLSEFSFSSKQEVFQLTPNENANCWIKWNSYSNTWEPVDECGTDLFAVDDDNTRYGVRLYLELKDGYIFSDNYRVSYEDGTGREIEITNRVHTTRENLNAFGASYLTIDFGYAKAPAPVVFENLCGTTDISALQMDALEFLADRNLIYSYTASNGIVSYDINKDSKNDFTVDRNLRKMSLIYGHMEGQFTIDSKYLKGTHFTSVTFDFPTSVDIRLSEGAQPVGTKEKEMLTFLATSDLVIFKKATGLISQFDLDTDGSFDIEWDQFKETLYMLPSNSIRGDFYLGSDNLAGTNYSSIYFSLRVSLLAYLNEGPAELEQFDLDGLSYLAANKFINSRTSGTATEYDLDKDGNFDVSVSSAKKISKLSTTNISGFYTIRKGLPMDCGIESFTFIFSDDLVFDFSKGTVDLYDEWYGEALWNLTSKDLISSREGGGITYYDIDKDGTDDLQVADDSYDLEILPACSISGSKTFSKSQLGSGSYSSITFLCPSQITSITLSVKAPATGSSPAYSVTLPSGAKYVNTNDAFSDTEMAKNGVIWSDFTTDTRLNPSGSVFEEGHKYEVAIAISASDGCLFAFGAEVKVNGYVPHGVINNGDTLIAYLRFAALKPNPTPSLDTVKTVEVGKSFQYKVAGVAATSITWSVGNTSIATVSSDGTVTGKSAGSTYLYAKLPDGSTVKCLIRVIYPALKISYTEKTLHINQVFAFSASGAAGQKITWSVGNTAVAVVDASGKVAARTVGNTYLYAKSADGRSAKCLLKVIDPGTLGISYTEKTVYLGRSFTFTAKNAGILKPTWSVGNTSIATVDSATGKVTPKSAGNTYLYVKTADGRSAKCLLKIVDPGPLSITYTEKTIKVGESFTFTAKNPAGQTVTWKVGNTAVATVSSTGAATAKVTGKTVANTYLYASTPDGREVKCLLRIVA